MSERRACLLVAADRKMIRYRSRRPPDVELRTRLRGLANQRRRFGYRRLYILLREQGEPSGINRIYRLYREEGLTVRKRKARRRSVGTRAPILIEAKVNARWSLDFVLAGSPDRDGTAVRDLASVQLGEVKKKLKELRALERSLETFVEECSARCAGGPAGNCVILEDLGSPATRVARPASLAVVHRQPLQEANVNKHGQKLDYCVRNNHRRNKRDAARHGEREGQNNERVARGGAERHRDRMWSR